MQSESCAWIQSACLSYGGTRTTYHSHSFPIKPIRCSSDFPFKFHLYLWLHCFVKGDSLNIFLVWSGSLFFNLSISWLDPTNPRPFSPTAHYQACIRSDLWSVTCVVIRCHPCLSITQILIDKILWQCTVCPFKGYCPEMLRINTDLICHSPQERPREQGSWEQVRKNSVQLKGL